MEPTTTAAAATDLTAVFARIQGMLLSQESAQTAATQLAKAACDLIDTAAGAGVSLIDATGNRTTTAGAFDTRAEHRLVLLASAAGTLLGAAQGSDAPQRLSESLRQAIADRTSVETATGMLMERHTTDHEAARRMLLAASREQGHPLAQLARQVVGRATDSTD